MTGLLESKVAIVTGSGSGIGRGVALAFASEGARVVVAELDPARAERTAEAVRARGAQALTVPCDVADRAQVDRCVATTIEAFGGVDILVNNAIAPPQMHPLLETTTELAESMWRTGPLGSMYFMQACHPSLRERHGTVVNVGSRAGMDGNEGWAAYAPAKEAIRTLTKVAAREWGGDGIRVNTICPAAASPAYEGWAAEHPDLAAIQVAEKALGRYGDCELDIGRAVVLLASDYACYITGNTLMADGGSCR